MSLGDARASPGIDDGSKWREKRARRLGIGFQYRRSDVTSGMPSSAALSPLYGVEETAWGGGIFIDRLNLISVPLRRPSSSLRAARGEAS